MVPERFKLLNKILKKRQPDLRVVMDEVHKLHNFSAIVRTCDAIGASDVHYIPAETGLKVSSGLAQGSQKWVNVNKHKDLHEAISELKEQNFTVVAANFSDNAINCRDYDFTQPTAILMGTELQGVSDKAISLCDHEIFVPMVGMVESLNVSVACAVILYEAQRQREAAGMYNECRITPDNYKHILFEWSYPKIARHCQQNKLPYPELNEVGDIIGEVPGSAGIPLKGKK